MSDYKSMTKILNDVYDGTSLNVFDYGSATDILNMIHDPSNNALKVNIIGGGGSGNVPAGGTTDQVLIKASNTDYDTEWADGGGGTIGATGPAGPAGPAGPGVSTGGTTDQVLVKVSGTDYDTTWATAPSGGSAGLVNGAGTDSIRSSDDLTTTPALANSDNSISIGEAAVVCSGVYEGISIGHNAMSEEMGISIGSNTISTGFSHRSDGGVSIGSESCATLPGAVAIGPGAKSNNYGSIAIGEATYVSSDSGIALGRGTTVTTGLGFGFQSSASNWSIVMGSSACGICCNGISIGNRSYANGNGGISIGEKSNTTTNGSIALGCCVVGNIANTLSTKSLELQTHSSSSTGGIILYDVNAVGYRIYIDISGEIQIVVI